MKATWNNAVIAESDKTIVVESNHYFPPSSVKMEHLKKSGNTYICPWKGVCDYYDVVVGDPHLSDGASQKAGVNHDAAWMYPEPKEAAKEIKGHFAFWRGVEVLASTPKT
jgi:uncharacterized protein (DUF427 family)